MKNTIAQRYEVWLNRVLAANLERTQTQLPVLYMHQ